MPATLPVPLPDFLEYADDEIRIPGHSSPGVFLLRPGHAWQDILDQVVLMSVAGLPDEYRDQIRFIPE